MLYILIVLSSDADATAILLGENVTMLTSLRWPLSVCSTLPLLAVYSMTVLSSDADASILPSGEKAIVLTSYA